MIDEKPLVAETEPVNQQDEKSYPPFRAVIPAMAAIYLAVFLVALV